MRPQGRPAREEEADYEHVEHEILDWSGFYNEERLHEELGDVPPAEYEEFNIKTDNIPMLSARSPSLLAELNRRQLNESHRMAARIVLKRVPQMSERGGGCP